MKILKRECDLYAKLDKIDKLLQKLNIEIEIGVYNEVIINDKKNNAKFKIVDNDSGELVSNIPSFYEIKLAVYE